MTIAWRTNRKGPAADSRAFIHRRDRDALGIGMMLIAALAGAGHAGGGAARHAAFVAEDRAGDRGTTRAGARAIARRAGCSRVGRSVGGGAEQAAAGEQRVEQNVGADVRRIEADRKST